MADTDTQEKAEDVDKLNYMDYDDFRTYLDEKQEKLVGRQGVQTPHSHNRMVDAVQTGAGGAPMPEAACAPAAWSGAAADPWAGETGADPWALGASGVAPKKCMCKASATGKIHPRCTVEKVPRGAVSMGPFTATN